MFDDTKLWKDRFNQRIKDLGRYLRYIFNGHLVIVMVFLIGGGAYYYQKWIQTLPLNFPVEWIMAILLGIALTYSPVYNFLLEADRVFLLPLENKMNRYFFRSGSASLIFQGYIFLIVLAVLMPLYAHVNKNGFHALLPFFIALLVIKGWNLAVYWRIHYLIPNYIHVNDFILRFILNVSFTFFLLKHGSLLILLLLVIVMIVYYRVLYIRTKNNGLKWDTLIDQEEKRLTSFYRFANLFTDVPKLKESVHRRRWLDFLLKPIVFNQKHSYLYLFSRTFLRSSDYLGLFIRLSVIGILALYFVSFGIGEVFLAILFLYLTGFQLLPLWNHHQNKLWVDLYPVSLKMKLWAFHFLLMLILSVQTILFAIFIFIKGEISIALYEILAGLIFNSLFVFMYSKNRLKSSFL
ncbi:MAG: ABC transporter permease [Bacillota bacterium]|nr:ABC transporter permease [Bacillota bacterium]